jgi:hypothetical protein
MRTLSIVALAAVASLAYAEHRRVKPGDYEMTTTMQVEGMPDVPPHTRHYCITPEEAAKDPTTLLRQPHGNEVCSTKDVRDDGDRITWTMVCTSGDQETRSSGAVSLTSDGFAGTVDVVESGPKGKRKMGARFQARRTGECR